MKKRSHITKPIEEDTRPDNGSSLFRNEFKDITPIKQDKILFQQTSSKEISRSRTKNHDFDYESRQAAATFQFSDAFEAHFDQAGPLKYVKAGLPSYEVKRLRRGEFPPDLILDLHGLNKEQTKLELSALITAAQKQHVHCVCIVHGVSGHVLKTAVPNYLVQHPSVEGFHQAPLEWGGKGALLVLIEQTEAHR